MTTTAEDLVAEIGGFKTAFSPEDSGLKVEKQREIRAMKPVLRVKTV